MCNLSQEIKREGKAEGRAEGRIEGKIETLLDLVKKGFLTIKNAATELGISEEEFCKKYSVM